jgi:hypothetical protein
VSFPLIPAFSRNGFFREISRKKPVSFVVSFVWFRSR